MIEREVKVDNNLSDEEKALEDIILTRVMRLNATVNGIVFGLIIGLLIFIATIWLVIKGGNVVGPNLRLLGQFFVGYDVTYLGSLIGFIYGFITGFIIGYFFAAVYNWVVGLRERSRGRKR
jgi:hypothetical protein